MSYHDLPHTRCYKSLIDWFDPAHAGIDLIKDLTKKSTAGNAISSLPVPVPQPPVTAASAEVLAEQSAFAKANLAKKSFADTVYAGNTGGYFPGEGGSPGLASPGPKSYMK